jgi:ribosomal protein S14
VTSTFLHDDNKVPPDEVVERDAPRCKTCGHQMWVVRVETLLSDSGTVSKRDYECSRCGTKQSVRTRSQLIEPSSLASGS